jgi:hypothetical protein
MVKLYGIFFINIIKIFLDYRLKYMANNLQNALSSLLSINTNLWNKVSGVIDQVSGIVDDNYIFYKDATSNNLSTLVHGNDGRNNTDGSNWLDLNDTTGKLEVKLNYGNKSVHGLLKAGDNISVTGGIISVPIASQSTAGVIKLGSGLSITPEGVVSVVASGVVMDRAAKADYADEAGKTTGTLTINGSKGGTQTFNGSADVTIDLSNTIELSSVQSIPQSSTTSATPKLLYTPNGQTAIVTSTGIIPTSEEVAESIDDNTVGKQITSVDAVRNYITNRLNTAASKVSIWTETSQDGTKLNWKIDNGEPSSLLIEREKWLNNVTYDPSSQMMTFEVEGGNTFDIPVSSFIQEYQAGSGIEFNTSTATFYLQKDTNVDSKFLQINDDTIGLSGITDAINAATSGAVELGIVPTIPENATGYTHPTLVFTSDGETAIVVPGLTENNGIIPTSEKTVDEIDDNTDDNYIVTVGAFKDYMETFDAGFATLRTKAEALNNEITSHK